MKTNLLPRALILAFLVASSSQLPSAPGWSNRLSIGSPAKQLCGIRDEARKAQSVVVHPPLRIRGGGETETVEEEGNSQVSLLDELKNNLSWNPADHPSAFHWALCAILNLYVMFGAPFAGYIPVLKDLALSRKPKKEKVVTKADLARMEREAIRKEQDEEFEKSLLEDKVKAQAEEKKRALMEEAEKAAQEEAEALNSVVDALQGRIEDAKKQLTDEPEAGAGVVMLRLRCPDGLQLTRRFKTSDTVAVVYAFLDVERYKKAENSANPQENLAALANEEYSLVSTRPKLSLDDKAATIADAGVTTSCALMVKPVVKDE